MDPHLKAATQVPDNHLLPVLEAPILALLRLNRQTLPVLVAPTLVLHRHLQLVHTQLQLVSRTP
jgi:hypothetical protein